MIAVTMMLLYAHILLSQHAFSDLTACNLGVNRSIETPEHLDQNQDGIVFQLIRFLRADDILMLCFSEVVVCDSADTFNDLLSKIFLRHVAVIVYEYFEQHA